MSCWRVICVLLFSTVMLAHALVLQRVDDSGVSSEQRLLAEINSDLMTSSSQLRHREVRSIAKTELAYRIEKIEEKLQHLITALEPKYKLGLDDHIVERSGIDLKPAMNGKLWLSQFSPETQASFKEARRLIQQYGQFALLHSDQSPLEVAEVLILGGADVNLRDPADELQNTILHKACTSRNLNLIKLLYDFRADFSIRNSANLTAWDVVAASDFHSAQDFLKTKGLSEEVHHV